MQQNIIKLPCPHCGKENIMAAMQGGAQFMLGCQHCGRTITGGVGVNMPAQQVEDPPFFADIETWSTYVEKRVKDFLKDLSDTTFDQNVRDKIARFLRNP